MKKLISLNRRLLRATDAQLALLARVNEMCDQIHAELRALNQFQSFGECGPAHRPDLYLVSDDLGSGVVHRLQEFLLSQPANLKVIALITLLGKLSVRGTAQPEPWQGARYFQLANRLVNWAETHPDFSLVRSKLESVISPLYRLDHDVRSSNWYLYRMPSTSALMDSISPQTQGHLDDQLQGCQYRVKVFKLNSLAFCLIGYPNRYPSLDGVPRITAGGIRRDSTDALIVDVSVRELKNMSNGCGWDADGISPVTSLGVRWHRVFSLTEVRPDADDPKWITLLAESPGGVFDNLRCSDRFKRVCSGLLSMSERVEVKANYYDTIHRVRFLINPQPRLKGPIVVEIAVKPEIYAFDNLKSVTVFLQLADGTTKMKTGEFAQNEAHLIRIEDREIEPLSESVLGQVNACIEEWTTWFGDDAA